MLLFDASAENPCEGGLELRIVTDQVMGGVSRGRLKMEQVAGRLALRMTGQVRLENNGGFIQMAGDLPATARQARGLRLLVYGNDESYGCHLRTEDLARPWQSYRQSFEAPTEWRSVDLEYRGFEPHRVEQPLRLSGLSRMGLVAIGRAFHADLAVARIELLTEGA